LCAALLAPLAHADVPTPMVVLVTPAPDGTTTLVTWTPPPGALSFTVYRGPAAGPLVAVQEGPETYYLDSNSTGMIYEVKVAGLAGNTDSGPSSRGDCVEMYSGFHVMVTLANCLPGRT
jgi:hypothetical protein